MRRKFTDEEREQRIEHRRAARQAQDDKVEGQRHWFQKRANKAVKRWKKGRKKQLAMTDRGVHRVPESMRDLYATFEVETPELGEYRGVQAPYANRRRMGQRGHQRQTRRRELPGAMARRMERNRKSWL